MLVCAVCIPRNSQNECTVLLFIFIQLFLHLLFFAYFPCVHPLMWPFIIKYLVVCITFPTFDVEKKHYPKALLFLPLFSLPVLSQEAKSQPHTQIEIHSHTSLCVKRCDGLQQSNNISWVPAGCEEPEPFKFVGENRSLCLFLSLLSSPLLSNESHTVPNLLWHTLIQRITNTHQGLLIKKETHSSISYSYLSLEARRRLEPISDDTG